MRKSKISASDMEKRDLLEYERSHKRNRVYKELIPEKDKGWVRLSNGVVFLWHTDRELAEGELRDHVPSGSFVLAIDSKKYAFDLDEFRKWLRWC